ncbi:hypothetical protein [Deinococcus sonorensis]
MASIAIADWTVQDQDSAQTLKGDQVALFGGTPGDRPEPYAAQVKAPVLVIQGRHDTRCPARGILEDEQHLRAWGRTSRSSGSTPGTARLTWSSQASIRGGCCSSRSQCGRRRQNKPPPEHGTPGGRLTRGPAFAESRAPSAAGGVAVSRGRAGGCAATPRSSSSAGTGARPG